jgi:NAD(P)-dependent dehydrogenase (short-subunit alcohol dehydrogenase family)
VVTKLREGGATAYSFDRAAIDDPLNIVGDVTRSKDLQSAVDRIGPIDLLVHCAGVPGQSLRTIDVSDDEWNA